MVTRQDEQREQQDEQREVRRAGIRQGAGSCGRRLAALVVVLLLGAVAPDAPGATASGPNAWTDTGSLITGRQGHTATLLPNGTVLVAGGEHVGKALVSAEVYDPRTGRWTRTGTMTAARVGHTATLLPSGTVLVAGGRDEQYHSLASAEVYDPRTGQWTATRSMATGRYGHTATLLPDGTVLVAGGSGSPGSGPPSSAEVYDPRTKTWTSTGSMRTARTGHTATLLRDGRVLVAGGCSCTGAELYDPRTKTWTVTGDMLIVHSHFTATALRDGRVLVAGGGCCDPHSTGAEVYDPRTGRWMAAGHALTYRTDHTATLLANGMVLVAGGSNFYGRPPSAGSAELYDPRTGTWLAAGRLTVGRSLHTATLLQNGTVLVAGGASGDVSGDNSAEVYTPGPSPYISLSSSSLVFGRQPQPVGTRSAAQTVTITNTGTLPLTVRRVTFAGAAAKDYAATTTCTGAAIAIKHTCTIRIRFVPTAGGSRVATLLIADNAPNSPHSVSVSGIAVAAHPSANMWSPTGSLRVARAGQTATLLPNGLVLVAGGCCDTSTASHGLFNKALASAELYDPRTGRWAPTGSMSAPRTNHTATLLPNGTVLVTGGAAVFRSCCDSYDSAEVYNPHTGRWTPTGSMATARVFHTATLLPRGTVLVVGGCCDAGGNKAPDSDYCGHVGCPSFSSAELYDPHTGMWTATGSMRTGREKHTATLLPNGRVLVSGGDGNDGMTFSSAELYDPHTGRWTPTAAMASARFGHTATLLRNGQVLVAGGCCTDPSGPSLPSTSFSSAELYDPRTGRWTVTGSMSDKRADHTATLLSGGQVLVAGGYDAIGYATSVSSAPVTSTELYEPATGQWTSVGSLVTARGEHTATLLSVGALLIVGGARHLHDMTHPDYGLNSAELYTPGSSSFVSFSPHSLEFGYQAAGTPSITRTVTVTNTGSTALTIGAMTLGGANATDFTARTGCLSRQVAPGGACTIGVVFTPAAMGRREASLSLVDTAAGSPHGVPLSGIGASLIGAHAWSPAGSMATGRIGHTATLLPNGLVLVAGGCCDKSRGSYSNDALASAELYDPRTGRWRLIGSMAVSRSGHTATLLRSGQVLVTGGSSYYAAGSGLASAELYDPRTGHWTATGSMSAGRSLHTATLLPSGQVLVVGGAGPGAASAELYNPGSGRWTATGSLHMARWQHTATLLRDGRVLVAGGCCTATAEAYDPKTGTWTATGSMTTSRYNHTATLLRSGQVLVTGGNGDDPAGAELYDPRLRRWTATTPMHDARAQHTATLLPDGTVLVVGSLGSENPPVFNAEVYDPRTRTWAPGHLTTARTGHTATLLSTGQVLIAGGCCSSGSKLSTVYASAELYTPANRSTVPQTSGVAARVPNTWSPTASMSTGRELHTTTLLPDGRVLVADGCCEAVASFSGVALYDPHTGTWAATGRLAMARSSHTATLLSTRKVL